MPQGARVPRWACFASASSLRPRRRFATTCAEISPVFRVVDFTMAMATRFKIAPDGAKIAFLSAGSARALRADYFQIGEACQIARNLMLHFHREIGLS